MLDVVDRTPKKPGRVARPTTAARRFDCLRLQPWMWLPTTTVKTLDTIPDYYDVVGRLSSGTTYVYEYPVVFGGNYKSNDKAGIFSMSFLIQDSNIKLNNIGSRLMYLPIDEIS